MNSWPIRPNCRRCWPRARSGRARWLRRRCGGYMTRWGSCRRRADTGRTDMAEPDDKPGVLDRLRAKFGWFDRVMRAQQRYNDRKGDFYAAGITYFTVFALFPLLMV